MDSVMKTIKFGNGFIIFILFFGIALLDAVQSAAWLKAGFWIAIGSVFLVADGRNNK
jgi:hypothetical protein